MESKFDTKTIKQIRQGCLRELFLSLGSDIHKFVDMINEGGAGWYFEDDYLYVTMSSCPCPMLEKTKITDSLTWCHCTAGYGKRFWEIVFALPVEAEIVHSQRQGYDECLVRLSIS